MYHTYILLCSDKTLYTGSTNNIEKRLDEHNSGKGAKYLCGRTPAQIIYLEKFQDRSSAMKREAQVKKLSRKKKIELIRSKN